MRRQTLFSILFFFMSGLLPAVAQISGILTDPKGKFVANAEVFINRTTIRATTDDFGQFSLNGIPPGFQEVVAYKKGLALYRGPMRIQAERTYNLKLQLQPEEKKVRGKASDTDMADFSRALLGDEGLMTINEKQVDVLKLDNKYAVLSGPVIIEYPNTGYRINAYFSSSNFIDASTAALCYQEYQLSDVNQNIAYEKTRMALYRGSLRHLLMALAVGKASQEGFTVTDVAGNTVDMTQMVTPSSIAGYFRMKPDGPLTVKFLDKTSTLTATTPLDFNKLGILLNSQALQTSGAMSQPSLAHQLPVDYLPISGDVESSYAEALKNFYEQVYVQTDKPYYYPGEPLWFKAYLNYYSEAWRDSLSDVLHVELLNPEHEALNHRMYRIERGTSHGDFILPDSIPPGIYHLRAFTSLQQNFGDAHLFTKPLHVMKMTDKADPVQQQPLSEHQTVVITPKKDKYHPRELITLEFSVNGSEGAGPSNLSVAVTDAAQVIPIPEATSIMKNYPIDGKSIAKINDLKYRNEKGISFYGKFLNNKGIGEKTQLNFIQWKTGDVLYAETGEDGMFWQTGLQFTDSARFSYKSDKAKGKPYGKVIVLPREEPAFHAPVVAPLKVVEVGSIQRIFSDYEVPKDNTLLDEVAVKASRINNDDVERAKKRPYGRADRTLTAKQLNINSANLLWALVGKVPGLVVNPVDATVLFSRAQANSIIGPVTPLVTVNDIPMGGDPGQTLLAIDPNIVESIEFTSRINVLYGSQGANGVIAVYTKSGISMDTTDPNFQTIKLPGFSRVRKFQAPDYSNPTTDATAGDYRATIYWNPDVQTSANGKAEVTFFAADLPGMYRVVVDGITADGKPIHGEVYLSIEEKP